MHARSPAPTRLLAIAGNHARTWTSLLLAAVLLGGAPLDARAAARPTDLIAGVPVSEHTADVAAAAPDLGAATGVLMTDDGRVLWARAPREERPMASTTKIMTAVVALERGNLADEVTVSSRAAAIGGASVGLGAGDRHSLGDLLEALLVVSGNDAAVAIAEHVAGSVEEFVTLMNETAERLGLEDTAFANAHGLDAPGHHTSAMDLATVARYAMGMDEFRRAVGVKEMTFGAGQESTEYENSNLLIGSVEGATGVKTGWTDRAGYCLVASAERGGIELFAVVLGTRTAMERYQQATLLLEWGFVHYAGRRLAETGEVVGEVVVSDYLDMSVDAVVGVPADVPVFDLAGEVTRRVQLAESVDAPLARGDRLGTLSFVQGDRLITQVPLIAIVDVRRPTLPERVWIALVRAWRSLFGGPGELEPAT